MLIFDLYEQYFTSYWNEFIECFRKDFLTLKLHNRETVKDKKSENIVWWIDRSGILNTPACKINYKIG